MIGSESFLELSESPLHVSFLSGYEYGFERSGAELCLDKG
jgi:hypothetical protein